MVKLIFGVTDYTIFGTVQRVPCDKFSLAYSIRDPYGLWGIRFYWNVANDYWGATA